MDNLIFITKNSRQTKEFGRILAEEILKTKQRRSEIVKKQKKKATVIALFGDLGAGKTTFSQGFIKGLGSREKVKSPTFVLMHEHKLKMQNAKRKIKNKKQIINYKLIYHFDCYRINKQKEILDLGFKEILANPKNIVLIEWAERIKKILPKERIEIYLKHLGDDEREIMLKI